MPRETDRARFEARKRLLKAADELIESARFRISENICTVPESRLKELDIAAKAVHEQNEKAKKWVTG